MTTRRTGHQRTPRLSRPETLARPRSRVKIESEAARPVSLSAHVRIRVWVPPPSKWGLHESLHHPPPHGMGEHADTRRVVLAASPRQVWTRLQDACHTAPRRTYTRRKRGRGRDRLTKKRTPGSIREYRGGGSLSSYTCERCERMRSRKEYAPEHIPGGGSEHAGTPAQVLAVPLGSCASLLPPSYTNLRSRDLTPAPPCVRIGVACRVARRLRH